jgi:tetratricopeptide (TPR) repeat protein
MSPKNGDRSSKSSGFGKVMRWVGYITAILSLAGALGGMVKVLSRRVETRRQVDALLSSATVHAGGKDYETAWQNLEQASTLDPTSAKVQVAEENMAMTWLDRDIHAGPTGKFAWVTEKLKPVLARGVSSSKPGPRQADLLAHLGWCYFLEYRDQYLDANPAAAAEYAKAVEEDPNNPYAQSMWGHWLLWGQENVPEAEKHFSAALASHRETSYVRGMQLGALLNHRDREADEEIVRVANEMRKQQQTIDADVTDRIFGMYYSEIDPWAPLPVKFVNAVLPQEHLETFHWLFDKVQLDDGKAVERSYYLGVLEEVAGRREEALAQYRAVQAKTAENNSVRRAADSGIKRLSKTTTKDK